jgi:L-rhamnose mutarotase
LNRISFTLRVRPEAIEEYKARHREVWPEMLDALTRSGWHNYSLFLAEDGLLVGYFETPGTFDEALEAMAAEPMNAAWQEQMAPFFDSGDGETPADRLMTRLEPVFHLR